MMNLNTLASLLSSAEAFESTKALTKVCIDSRMVEPGDLFIAIEGEQFDGHHFILEAQNKGAVAAVLNRRLEASIPQFIVKDTIWALAQIARYHRQSMPCPVVALTGSNGKTTVKEMIAAILPKPAHATRGNLNNHIGAPLSVLELKAEHRYAVFELGANHPGEIAHTVAVVCPDITLINNIAPAHIEGFGSIEGVARAKGEIHQGLKPGGIAVVNEDDAYAHFWDSSLRDKEVLRFSSIHSADVYAKDLSLENGFARFTLVTPNGCDSIRLKIPGLHTVQNALAASTCAYALGLSNQDIANALNQFMGVKGRMTFLDGKNQSLIIDDTYNANLRSVLTALEVLSKRAGKKIFVFGDMGELGQWTVQHHQEVGFQARQLGIDRLLSCGLHSELASKAFGCGGIHFPSQTHLVQELLNDLDASVTVLVKGSRSSAMENIVSQLLN